MRVAIFGGKLQGVEATYLAKKAGWVVILFDRRPEAQASKLADVFYCMDILASRDEIKSLLTDVDVILPAIEDIEVLRALEEIAESAEVPLAFDSAAYAISSSKQISNQMFTELEAPAPRPWPEACFPLLVKPSGASGSEGVHIVCDKEELQSLIADQGKNELIIEEFLEGPSFSLEVFGFAGEYRVFQVTELEMDEFYDCKRVLAPTKLHYRLIDEFEGLALKLASALHLNGIMDVETILHDGKLKVLEIDARIPSQTPTAVYYSSGINMIECLGYSFMQGSLYIPIPKRLAPNERYVIYEHLKVTPKKIEFGGEHILAEAGPLMQLENFFGADEVLTDYYPGKADWVLTLITRGATPKDAWIKRDKVLQRIQAEFNISEVIDHYPPTELSLRRWEKL